MMATSCVVQTDNTSSGKNGQAEEADVNTETLERPVQSIETLISEDKCYTFGEILELLNGQKLVWEAYYNDTGERITMYCEDGTEFMFLGFGAGGEGPSWRKRFW